jgi:hypothetical protein
MLSRDPTYFSMLNAVFGNLEDFYEAQVNAGMEIGDHSTIEAYLALLQQLKSNMKKARLVYSRLQRGDSFDHIPKDDFPTDPQFMAASFPSAFLVSQGYPKELIRCFSIGSVPPKAKRTTQQERLEKFHNTLAESKNSTTSARARQREERADELRRTPLSDPKPPQPAQTPSFPTQVSAMFRTLNKVEKSIEDDLKPRIFFAKSDKEKQELVTKFIIMHIDTIEFDGIDDPENRQVLRMRRKSLVEIANKLAPVTSTETKSFWPFW